MPLRFRDPFGETATVEYDTHDLLKVRTTDPLENSVTAQNDYRRLAPDLVTDPNGNRSAVAFDVLGMVAGTAVMGKESETVGDSLGGFQAQLTQAQIDAFFADPRGLNSTELLGNATSRIIYDETRFQRLEQPPFGATIVRETHVSDLGDGEETAVQVSLAYWDGVGRTIQNKVQAEPGPVEDGGDIVRPRWTTSGWTIFNNKGNPVKQYEPFFSADHAFEFGVTVGVSPTLFYDPVGRVVATLHPNHTWEKVIFDPWRQETWDVNDTVLAADPASDPDVGGYFERLDDTEYLPAWHQARIDGGMGNPEQDAAQKAAAYADTPAIVHFDSLGRPFLSIANNGSDGQYQTRTEQDIEGNPLRIIDDRGNVVMAYQVESNGNLPVRGYDEAGRPFYENSMDSSERWVLADVGGKPISSWDSRGHILRSTYDELQRPTHLFVLREGEPELLAEMTVYGEGHPDAESLNLRGQVYQAYDGAGVVTGRRFDFKDNPLESSRQLAREYRTTVDWSALADLKELGEIEAAGASLLGADVFTIQTDYDALNRPVAITTPDNSVTLPTYNEANLLEQMAVRLRGADQATPFVANIDYNARGQRERITYATADGTNFTTTYGYDPETFRLTLLDTLRHRDNRALQNLNYAHDPVGNITSIRDNAQQIVFFSNTQVEPVPRQNSIANQKEDRIRQRSGFLGVAVWSVPSDPALAASVLHGRSSAVARLIRPLAQSTTGSDSWSRRLPLRGAAFVAVVQSADFGKLHHLAKFGTLRLPLDRSVLVQPQVRSRSMIIAEIVFQDSPQVFPVEHNDVVQTLPADRSDQPLGESILPRTSRGRQHLLDAHALDSLTELVAVDPIAVAQQIAWRGLLREGLDHLLARPERRGIGGHVEMHHAPTLQRKDHEYIQDAETDRWDSEEVQRHQIVGVIGQKDPPALRRRLTGLGKQPRDGALGNLQSQLEQLAVDARRAPERIRLPHRANQLTDLLGHTRSPGRSPERPALPTPVASETLTMPGYDGLWSDDVYDRAPTGPTAGQPDPEDTIGLTQPRAFDASLVDSELLTKSEILKDEAPAARHSQVQQPNETKNKRDHGYQSARMAGPAVKGAWTPSSSI